MKIILDNKDITKDYNGTLKVICDNCGKTIEKTFSDTIELKEIEKTLLEKGWVNLKISIEDSDVFYKYKNFCGTNCKNKYEQKRDKDNK